ncbi:hypothetical protein BU16DRAFT_560190 [Lophium mytilinum]|uniref:Uncharacterized protein n=1 Tax=Lophium mytilinum TaxID=390894 RepID=A0A6A6QWS8_9PEZI|nr:hypothetical protein BU16DRAFT_560190 [Lophium mytilinum]
MDASTTPNFLESTIRVTISTLLIMVSFILSAATLVFVAYWCINKVANALGLDEASKESSLPAAYIVSLMCVFVAHTTTIVILADNNGPGAIAWAEGALQNAFALTFVMLVLCDTAVVVSKGWRVYAGNREF